MVNIEWMCSFAITSAIKSNFCLLPLSDRNSCHVRQFGIDVDITGSYFIDGSRLRLWHMHVYIPRRAAHNKPVILGYESIFASITGVHTTRIFYLSIVRPLLRNGHFPQAVCKDKYMQVEMPPCASLNKLCRRPVSFVYAYSKNKQSPKVWVAGELLPFHAYL